MCVRASAATFCRRRYPRQLKRRVTSRDFTNAAIGANNLPSESSRFAVVHCAVYVSFVGKETAIPPVVCDLGATGKWQHTIITER